MGDPGSSAQQPPAPEPPPNPYAVGGEPPPGTPERPGPPPRRTGQQQRSTGKPPPPPADKAVRRRVQLVALLAAVAAVASVPLPPVGLGLGVAVLVQAIRLRRDPRVRALGATATVIPLLAGTFAVLVGGLLTALALFLAGELGDLRDCLAGANTRVAQANCQDAFREAVERRLPGVQVP